jgi:hypothetical protein
MIEAAPEIQAPPNQDGQQSQNGRQGNGQQNGRKPPQAAIDACVNLAENSSCSFVGRNQNTVSGECATPPNSSQLACKPAGGSPSP